MAKTLELRDGAEVSVETGLGFVTKVEDPRGRNAKVTIQAEHLDLPVSSWVDTNDVGLYNRVLDAAREGHRIGYRVVVKRKRGQPAELPLESIPSLQRIRDLEDIERVHGEIPTAPLAAEGDPAPTAAPPESREAAPVAASAPPATSDAPSPPPTAEGPSCSLCGGPLAGFAARRVSGELQHVECPGLEELTAPPERDEPVIATGSVPSPPPPAPPATRRPQPRVQEGKPWEQFNSDGSLNPGSYAYGAAAGMVLRASDLLLERAKSTAGAEGKFVAPSQGQIYGLSRRLLRAADLAQSVLRDDGHVARMASSHTRCRAAVFAALDVHPVPWGADKDELERWVHALADHASVIMAVTVSLIDPLEEP